MDDIMTGPSSDFFLKRGYRLARFKRDLNFFRRGKMEMHENITKKTDSTATAVMAPSPIVAAKKPCLADFLDEAACRAAVLGSLHPRGAHCPGCAMLIEDASTVNNFWAGRRCVCKRCGHWFTATAGTFLQGSQLSFAQIFLIASLVEMADADVPVSAMAAAAGVSNDTARIWIKRITAFNAE